MRTPCSLAWPLFLIFHQDWKISSSVSVLTVELCCKAAFKSVRSVDIQDGKCAYIENISQVGLDIWSKRANIMSGTQPLTEEFSPIVAVLIFGQNAKISNLNHQYSHFCPWTWSWPWYLVRTRKYQSFTTNTYIGSFGLGGVLDIWSERENIKPITPMLTLVPLALEVSLIFG